MAEPNVYWPATAGAAQEATEVEQLCHSNPILNQALIRIRDLLGEEAGEIDTTMKSLGPNIQSDIERARWMIRTYLSGNLTDREVKINKARIEKRYTALEEERTELLCLLTDQRDEFEMEKIAVERERVQEKMVWDQYMKEREVVLLSSVTSVMIKRERVMEELRNQVETKVRTKVLHDLFSSAPGIIPHIVALHTLLS